MLKKSLFAMTLAGSIIASEGSLPQGKLDRLNANYTSPRGDGTADYINFEDFGEYTKANLEVDNYNGLLIFSIEDQSFELDLSMLGITDAQKVNLSNLNFTNNAKNISLALDSADARAQELDTNIKSASINCTREFVYQDITVDLLSACLKNSKISAKHFRFKDESGFKSLVEANVTKTDMTIDNLKINVSNHSLKGELKSNISKGMRVKFEATTKYDSEQNRVSLRLNKAKAGIFSVKSKIFDAIKDIDSQNIEVQEPYIYIYMD